MKNLSLLLVVLAGGSTLSANDGQSFVIGGDGKKKKICTTVEQCCKRKRCEPKGINEFTVTTSGDISAFVGPSPVLPANVTYLAKGNPENPIAFCMHGFPDSAKTMRFLLDDLSKKGYYAVAPYLRGYAPTELLQTELPQPGLNALYVIQDQLDLLGALGAFDQSRAGKNIFIGHDWGVIYGPTVVNLSGVFEKYVGLAIPTLAIFTDIVFGSLGNFNQLKNLFYFFMHNITPIFGFNQDFSLEPVEPTNTARYRQYDMVPNFWRSWSPTANKKDQQVDIENAEQALLSDLTNLNLEQAISYYRDLLVGPPNPVFPLSVPSLYGFGLEDGVAIIPPQGLNLEEYTQLIKDTSPAGAEVFFSRCGGHFLHLDDTRFVNKQVLCFLKEDMGPGLDAKEKEKIYDETMAWCRSHKK